MTLGLALFTLFHVAVSLVGIAAGFVVAYGFVANKRLDRWNALFLTATVATSASGSVPSGRLASPSEESPRNVCPALLDCIACND